MGMPSYDLGLVGIIIALLGVGGGRLWSDRRINNLHKEIAKVQRGILSIHEKCHSACKEARMSKEKELETILEKEIKPRLQVGNLIMLELCQKIGVPKEKLEELRQAIFNDSSPGSSRKK